MNKQLLTMLLTTALIATACGAKPPAKNETKTNEKKVEQKANTKDETKTEKKKVDKETSTKKDAEKEKLIEQNAEINININKRYEENLGFATGKLDKDGKPTTNGTPNPDFNYILFIHKVEYDAKEDQLNIWVNDEFSQLSEEEKTSAIKRCQNFSSEHIEPYSDFINKSFVVIKNTNNEIIGRSKATNKAEFKFNK